MNRKLMIGCVAMCVIAGAIAKMTRADVVEHLAGIISTDVFYGSENREDEYCDTGRTLPCTSTPIASLDCGRNGGTAPCYMVGPSNNNVAAPGVCFSYESWIGDYYCVHKGYECTGFCSRVMGTEACYGAMEIHCSSTLWWVH